MDFTNKPISMTWHVFLSLSLFFGLTLVSLSTFLIYSANIPEETFWYIIREINPNTGRTVRLVLGKYGFNFWSFLLSFSLPAFLSK
jgi:hypothetical protein